MTLDDIINSGDPREIKRALAVKMFEHGLDRNRISSILSISESYVVNQHLKITTQQRRKIST